MLKNGGFETGSSSPWQVEGGTLTVGAEYKSPFDPPSRYGCQFKTNSSGGVTHRMYQVFEPFTVRTLGYDYALVNSFFCVNINLYDSDWNTLYHYMICNDDNSWHTGGAGPWSEFEPIDGVAAIEFSINISTEDPREREIWIDNVVFPSDKVDLKYNMESTSGNTCTIRLSALSSTGELSDATTEEASGAIIRIMSVGL